MQTQVWFLSQAWQQCGYDSLMMVWKIRITDPFTFRIIYPNYARHEVVGDSIKHIRYWHIKYKFGGEEFPGAGQFPWLFHRSRMSWGYGCGVRGGGKRWYKFVSCFTKWIFIPFLIWPFDLHVVGMVKESLISKKPSGVSCYRWISWAQ